MMEEPSLEGSKADNYEEFRYWRPERRRFRPDSPFFDLGNIERELLSKQTALDLKEDEKRMLIYEAAREFSCPIAGCGARLSSLEGFEDHYKATHVASCSVCSRIYPTPHLLSIHISETHDSFFQAKVARGFAMYECLVESCELKFKSSGSRKQHLVDKHRFPTSFEFLKKMHPSKKARTKKKKNKQQSFEMEIETDNGIDNLVTRVSRLSTSDSSPSTVSFGHRRSKGLAFVPRSVSGENKH